MSDNIRYPGFFESVGNWFGQRENVGRGAPIQMPDGSYRVPTYNPDGSQRGLSPLDPSKDRDYNPADLAIKAQRAERKAEEATVYALRDRSEARQDHRLDQQLGLQRDQMAQTGAQITGQLANQNQAMQNQLQVSLAQLAQNATASRDSNALAAASLAMQANNSAGALDLKKQELTLESGFRERQMAADQEYRQQQITEARGARKLEFISRAAAALLA